MHDSERLPECPDQLTIRSKQGSPPQSLRTPILVFPHHHLLMASPAALRPLLVVAGVGGGVGTGAAAA